MDKIMIAPEKEILNLVAQLEKEVADLKKRISSLEKKNPKVQKTLLTNKQKNSDTPGRGVALTTDNEELKKLMED